VKGGDDCVSGEDCIREPPGVSVDASRGLARLAYISASGGGAIVVLGRDGTGAWRLWMVTQQQPTDLLELPGQLLACGSAETVELRAGPASSEAVAGRVARAQSLAADSFVLSQAGTPGKPGAGWYRVSGSSSGWISSDVSAALSSGCPLPEPTPGGDTRG
jgi:hypothetical protein